MGVPVVSFRHGGISETMRDGITGLLAPERDVELLAAHLMRYLATTGSGLNPEKKACAGFGSSLMSGHKPRSWKGSMTVSSGSFDRVAGPNSPRWRDMRKVLVFKETLLPPSETFILAQMNELNEYVPVLAGLERARPSLPLPHGPLLLSDLGPSISDARSKLYRRTGIAPLFHARAKRSRPSFCTRILPVAGALRFRLRELRGAITWSRCTAGCHRSRPPRTFIGVFAKKPPC